MSSWNYAFFVLDVGYVKNVHNFLFYRNDEKLRASYTYVLSPLLQRI